MALQVKICGIMTPEHGRAAVAAGADLLGLVFAPSRRQITVAQAQAIVAAIRDELLEQSPVKIVGVFVNEAPVIINQVVAEVGLDWVQLSGHEVLADATEFRTPLVKAIRFDGHSSETDWLTPSAAARFPLLVDAHVVGSYGGAGVAADWQRAAALARQRVVWLAGGLNPANVAQAVLQVQPHVVDVSSGVETDGVKDVTKIQAFIRAAKQRDGAIAAEVATNQFRQGHRSVTQEA